MENTIRFGALNLGHPFYHVARGEVKGLTPLGKQFFELYASMSADKETRGEWKKFGDALLKGPTWQHCHNWPTRVKNLAKQIHEVGVEVLLLQEVSDRYAGMRPDDLPSQDKWRREGSRTLVDLVDELNALEEGQPWVATDFRHFYNSKDEEYHGATERGNAFIVDTRRVSLVEGSQTWVEHQRVEEDKEQLRRHPCVTILDNRSQKRIKLASLHATGYAPFTEKLKVKGGWESNLDLAKQGNEEVRKVLQAAKEGDQDVSIVGGDWNEEMHKDFLPADLLHRMPNQSFEGDSICKQEGFTSCWEGAAAEAFPKKAIDGFAVKGKFNSITVVNDERLRELFSDHQMVVMDLDLGDNI